MTPRPLRRRTAVIAAVTLAIALVIGGVTAWALTRGHPPRPTSAADVLTAAADEAAARGSRPRPDGASPYLRTETTRVYTDRGWRYSVTTVQTVRIDQENVAHVGAEANEPAFTSRDDWRAWRRAGSPTLTGVLPGPVQGTEDATVRVGDRDVPLDEAVAALDRPIDELLGLLAGTDPAGDAFTGGIRILLSPGLPATAQSAVWRALATVDGTEATSEDRGAATASGPATREHHVLTRPNGLAITVDAQSGRLAAVRGLDGARIRVGAAGFANCLQLDGPGGPAEIRLGCTAPGPVVADIAWDETWGGPEAHGVGRVDVGDCGPDCATGGTESFPIAVRLSEQQDCGYNLRLYTRLDITYVDRVPAGHDRVVTEFYRCEQ